MPAFISSGLFKGSYLLAITVVPLLFFWWSRPVMRGDAILPTRSIALLFLAVISSAAWLIFGAEYGVEYQSRDYVLGVTVINAISWVVIGLLALIARRHPNYVYNLAFHTVLFAWLAWCAFPYMGELP